MRVPLRIVLAGLGHAGQIHLRTYLQDARCRLVALADTCVESRRHAERLARGIPTYPSLDDALRASGPDVIVDLCVPAPQNRSLCRTAVRHGVQRLILEKPLGWQLSQAVELGTLLRDRTALYLDTYRFSRGIEALREGVEGADSRVSRIDIRFFKDRQRDSALARGFHQQAHADAWHIEGPHLVTIAERIAGDIVAVEDAHMYDMHVEGSHKPGHGGGVATVRHRGGTLTRMATELDSPRNERTVEVMLDNGESFHLYLPPSKSPEQVSHLEKRVAGRLEWGRAVEDRPMEQGIGACLEYFCAGTGEVPTIARGIAVNEILWAICALAKRSQPVPADFGAKAAR